MEDTNARVIENEEIEEITEPEVEEASDSDNAGALVAGIVGGFLAYAAIGGAKKLLAFIKAKRRAKKTAAESDQTEAVDAELTEVDDEETADSGEETTEE